MLLSFGIAAFGGVIVDSHDRRSLMMLRGVIGAALWATVAILFWLGAMSFAVLFAFACAATVIGGLIGHAAEAALRTFMPPDRLPEALAVNQSRDASAEVLAGPIAGGLMALHNALPFAFSSLGLALLGIFSSFLPSLRPAANAEPSPQGKIPFVKRAFLGFTWIFQSRQMVALTVWSAASNFSAFMAFTAMELDLVDRGYSPLIVSLVATSGAVAVIVGGFLTKPLVVRFRTGILMVVVALWFPACLIVPVASQGVPAYIVSDFMYSLIIPLSGAAVGAYAIRMVPDEMQGRFIAANTFLVGVPVAFTSVLAGLILSSFGSIIVFAVSLVIAIIPIAVITLERSLLAVGRPEEWPEAPPV